MPTMVSDSNTLVSTIPQIADQVGRLDSFSEVSNINFRSSRIAEQFLKSDFNTSGRLRSMRTLSEVTLKLRDATAFLSQHTYQSPGIRQNDNNDIDDILEDIFSIDDIDGIDGIDDGGNKSGPPTCLVDMTALAASGEFDEFVGREEESRHMMRALLGGLSQRHALLYGPSGRGKRSTIKRLAYIITHGAVPQELKDKKLMRIDLDQCLSRSDWKEYLKSTINWLADHKDEYICVINQVNTIQDKHRGEEVLAHLETKMEEGLQLIATADTYSRDRYFNSTNVSRIAIEDKSEERVESLVRKQYLGTEEELGIVVSEEAISTAFQLALHQISKQRLSKSKLHELTCGLLDLSIAEMKLRISDNNPGGPKHANDYPTLTRKVVQEVFSAETGIPMKDILGIGFNSTIPLDKPLELEDRLNAQVFGQELAVSAVKDAILRWVAGLKDPTTPVGTFLFMGPTGVGKTELAKCIAYELYGSRTNMVRIDMSEYQQEHEVSRLIGSPPGYVGYDEGGQLTNALRSTPKTVVLLDEIDKAHPNVLKIFLQVFDEGRLTDGQGKTVNCKDAIFIMTSNLMSADITDMLQEGIKQEEILNRIETFLMRDLSPEFYNRIDKVIPFNIISEEVFQKVIPFKLKGLQKEIFDLSGINIEWDQTTVDYLVANGYDERLGLRPLKRVMERDIKGVLTLGILQGDFTAGDHVQVISVNGTLIAEKVTQ